MDTLIEQAPRIIEEAAKSLLGVLALIIMILAVVSVIFFRGTTPATRVGIFILLFLGAMLFAWQIAQAGFQIPSSTVHPAAKLPAVSKATVVALENLPVIPDSGIPENLLEWWPPWLVSFFNSTEIIINRGSDEGIKKGDHFVVVQSKEITGPNGDNLGTTQKPGSRIRVVETKPKFSTCQIDSMAASAADAIDARLAKVKDQNELKMHPEIVSPVTVGEEVIAIPPQETAWWEELQKAIDKAAAKNSASDDERKVAYKALVDKADTFLQEHPTAYFAPDALFQKGWALYKLQEYGASVTAFELFLKHYPFHPSASGARTYIQEVNSTKGVANQQ